MNPGRSGASVAGKETLSLCATFGTNVRCISQASSGHSIAGESGAGSMCNGNGKSNGTLSRSDIWRRRKLKLARSSSIEGGEAGCRKKWRSSGKGRRPLY